MALFTAPTTWSDGQELTSAQLNALTTAIAASANSIINAQVAANAAISGSKIATNAITASHINPLAVSLDKLAAGATIVSLVQGEVLTPQSILGSNSERVVATSMLTVSARLGRILLLASLSGEVVIGSGVTRTVDMRIRDGSSNELAVNSYVGGVAIGNFVPINGMLVGQQAGSVPGVGTETYTATVVVSGGSASDQVVIEKARIIALEFA